MMKTRDPLRSKIMIGVTHSNICEKAALCEFLRIAEPTAIGIELPKDHAAGGGRFRFFGDLAGLLESRGHKIIELLAPYDRHAKEGRTMAIEHELRAYKHADKVLELKKRYVRTKLDMTGPEAEEWAEALDSAADNLRSEDSDFVRRSYEFNKKLEEHMLGQIRMHQPSVIIIGNAHAVKLNERLGDYKYGITSTVIDERELYRCALHCALDKEGSVASVLFEIPVPFPYGHTVEFTSGSA